MKTIQKDVDGRRVEIAYDDSDIDRNVIRILNIDSVELPKHLQQVGALQFVDQDVVFRPELKKQSDLIFETSPNIH